MERLKNRYIVGEFWVNFLFSFLVLSLLFSVESLFRVMDLLVRKTFSVAVLFKFFALAFSGTLSYTLPLTFLCATIAVFTRLAADREILILSSSGINPFRLVPKLLIVAVGCSLFLLSFNFYLLPLARLNKRTLVHGLRFENPLTLLQERMSVKDIPGVTIYVESIQGANLKNIVISYVDRNQKVNFLRAREAVASYDKAKNALIFSLKDGMLLGHSVDDARNLIRLKFSSYQLPLLLPEGYRGRIHPRLIEMTLTQIKRQAGGPSFLRTGTGLEESLEVNRRAVFAFAPILFLFFGAGLGIRLKQKSRSFHLGLGAVTGLSFFELLTVGELLARRTAVPGFTWLPMAIFVLGSWLLWK